MTGREEHAAGHRGMGSFPPEWGIPRGSRDSEERVEWVRSKLAQTAGARAHRKLAARDARLLAELRRLQIDAREEGPE